VTGRNRKLDIALELERIALEDDYFVSRKLYPNVDFYSASRVIGRYDPATQRVDCIRGTGQDGRTKVSGAWNPREEANARTKSLS
jgi:hypothetical protein